MKTAAIREFRANLAEMVEQKEPLLITRHSENVAIVFPLRDPSRVPVEVRRRIAEQFSRSLGLKEEPYVDDVVEAFMAGVDRTLIRENLQKTPEQRLRDLQQMQRLAEETRKAHDRLRETDRKPGR